MRPLHVVYRFVGVLEASGEEKSVIDITADHILEGTLSVAGIEKLREATFGRMTENLRERGRSGQLLGQLTLLGITELVDEPRDPLPVPRRGGGPWPV